MIRKSTVLLIVVIYCLTPYSIKKGNVQCQCGCREWPCYCCDAAENSCDGTSIAKGKCDSHNEFYAQSPAVIPYPFTIGFPLDRMGHVVISSNDSTRAGHGEPPMKPPPTLRTASIPYQGQT